METLVLKKRVYRESDLIVTFFSREKGKISGIARNAKKSKKRFGGRLEVFNLLEVDIKINDKSFNNISDVSITKSFRGIMNDLETFMTASFILEHLDIFGVEEEPAEDLFNTAVETFSQLENNENLLPKLLTFQLQTLKLGGYEPDFNSSKLESGNFRISDGMLVDKNLKADEKSVFEFNIDVIRKPETMDIFLAKVATNIKVLTKYIEYHTGKQFKTSNFLEGLNI